MIRPQNIWFVYIHNSAANSNVDNDFIQHLEQTTDNGHEDENVDLEAMDLFLVVDFSPEEIEVGPVYVSTSS